MAFADPPDLSPYRSCSDDRECLAAESCVQGTCKLAAVACFGDEGCQGDSRCACRSGGGARPCVDGTCLPWPESDVPFDPLCAGQAFSAAAFKPPAEKCHWAGGNVIMTPVVIDLDKDRKPEIVFSVYGENIVVAIRADTCKEVWRANGGGGMTGLEQLAAADLDGDGFPEIVVPGPASLTILDHNGKSLATAAAPGAGCCGGPAIADVDGKAPPEIGFGGGVFRYEKAKGMLSPVWMGKPAEGGTWGTMSLFADMDNNGTPELVTGTHVYDGATGNDKTPAALTNLGAPGGYPAVADFNRDGRPDIVLVQSEAGQQQLSVIDFAGDAILFGPYTVQGGGWGGTPTVGDYDGDGVPDIGLASQDFYYVYALKCARPNRPRDCKGADPGVLWQRATHDSSGGTGSSTFDFNGDGISEVVYRDECWLRVYDGRNGDTVFAQAISSGTALEYPVVADVDGSGHAAIVAPSDSVLGNTCAGNPEGQLPMVWMQPTQGVFVLVDPMRRWMPSRALWHQHTYHITEIGDDLKVPLREKSNWLSWNNYRVNVQGSFGRAGALPDFTGGALAKIDNGGMECTASERLWASVCNRGASDVQPGVPGSFYDADPRKPGAVRLCGTVTKAFLTPGDCEAVYCDRPDPPPGAQDLWFRVDDDGNKASVQSECKPDNDLLFLPQYECKNIG